jgi:hypothetical protein
LAWLLIFQGAAVAARKVELAVAWSELPKQVLHRKVALVLPDGVHLRGKVLDVTPEALLLDVTQSSDSSAHSPGQTTIKRDAVSVIRLSETKGVKRALWTSAGAGGGLAGGWLLAEGVYHVSGEGKGFWGEPAGAGLALGLAGAGGVIGYLVGRSSDRVETYIKIVPEQP